MLITSFMMSYFEATLVKTPWTIPALASSATSLKPKWVVRPVLSSAILACPFSYSLLLIEAHQRVTTPPVI